MIDPEAKASIYKVVSTCWVWLKYNDSTALEVDDQGYGDADEFGMHTLASGIVALWNLTTNSVVVQPSYEKQRWFGIIAGAAAMWEKKHRGQTHAEDAGISLHTLNMAYLRLYHECIVRRIIVPPTHSNPTTLQ